MPDDESLSLLFPETPKSDRVESRSGGRGKFAAFLINISFVIPILTLGVMIEHRPAGVQLFAMAAYTYAVLFIASDSFHHFVPWGKLTRGRVRLGHCFALVSVCGIVTAALKAQPHLPHWSVVQGRRGSVLMAGLFYFLLALAFFEAHWATKTAVK